MSPRTATVIIATLNEEENIDHVLDVALSDSAVSEVIVADGGSQDATVARVHERAHDDTRVTVLHNAHRGQAAGLNQAALQANSDLLVRLDGHTRYADDYVSSSLAAWAPGVAVGGPMHAEGSTPWARATACAMRDPLAIGPARFHHADKLEEVDTVYLGTFERSRFLEIGGYRSFPSGTVEDTDFYTRWRSSGGTVLVDPSIVSWYRPRDSWIGLARQFFRYGIGKAELVWLNGRLPSLRPLAPAALVAAAIVLVGVGVAWTWIPLVVLDAAWLAVLALIALRADTNRVRTAMVAATMHVGYGAGIWWGLITGQPTVKTFGMAGSHDSA